MDDANRFKGQMAEEHELITFAQPDFDEFQRGICAAAHDHAPVAATILRRGLWAFFSSSCAPAASRSHLARQA